MDQKGWCRCVPGVNALFNRATLNYNSFYVALCEPLLANYPETLQGVFKTLHAGKRYTAVSNIGRLLVLNACGGIYTDVDFLLPNEERKFPKNIDTILKVFGRCSKINFYLPAINLDGYCLVENQAAVLNPKNIGALNKLMRDMSRCMATNYEEIYLETANNAEYLASAENKRLERSMFTSPLHTKLMKAFGKRDFNRFNRVNTDIFKNQTSKGFMLDSFGEIEENPPMLKNGMRHYSYEVSGRLTYGIVVQYFEAHLGKVSAEKYITEYWSKFRQFFAVKSLDEQFQFVDDQGQRQGMYSWANPGFSRLSKLENAANLMKGRFLSKNKMVKKMLLLEFVDGAKNVKFGRLETKNSKQNREMGLKLLTDVIKKRNRYYLRVEDAKNLLCKFLGIAFIRIGVGGHTNMGNYAVKAINEAHFKDLRVLIDPDKAQLSYDDLEAAAHINRGARG
ncbi:hypothetical protein AAEX28_03110 [Lentisphaerota bacterium WC36G]|nr:hypothetical protein LJT99_05985 [Lentisphaerae bacterium WC36]